MPDVELIEVSRRFGARTILNQASAVFRRSEVTCVVGPSGSGKTTLARIIVGLDDAYTGDVRLDGASVRSVEPGARGVSFLFQQPPLLAQRSVEGNIATPLKIAGTSGEAIEKAVTEVCEGLSIEPLRTRLVGQLSGGERQRVALARCLVRRSPLLILDEPLKSAIEPELQLQIRSLIRRQQRELGQTVILVSHDPADVVALGDAVAGIDLGGRVTVQPIDECLCDPATITHADSVGVFHQVQYDSSTGILSVGGIPIPLDVVQVPKGVAQVRVKAENLRLVEGTSAQVLRALPLDSLRCLVELRASADPLTAGNSSLTVKRLEWRGDRVDIRIDPEGLLFFDAGGRRVRTETTC